MYIVRRTKVFERSLRRLNRSGKIKQSTIDTFDYVVNAIAKGVVLDMHFRDHALRGEYEGMRECHIQSDLLLVYKIESETIVLVLINIGSHSQIFG